MQMGAACAGRRQLVGQHGVRLHEMAMAEQPSSWRNEVGAGTTTQAGSEAVSSPPCPSL